MPLTLPQVNVTSPNRTKSRLATQTLFEGHRAQLHLFLANSIADVDQVLHQMVQRFVAGGRAEGVVQPSI